MKRRTQLLQIGLMVLVAFTATEAQAQSRSGFWNDVKDLVVRCAVQPYTIENGQKVYGHLESTCPEIQVQDNQARFELDGHWFTATLSDSADADEGDLNDILVTDESGNAYAKRQDIAAFGDILLGLAGGTIQPAERFEQELTN